MQVQPAGFESRGWMSFTLAAGAVLHLGGALQTVPTAWLSGADSTAASFLAGGIPQNRAKTAFVDFALPQVELRPHGIKHMRFTVISVAVAATPAGRFMNDGSVPTATLGAQVLTGDGQTIPNNRMGVFNFKLFNNSAGNMIVEVEVWG